MNDKLWFFWPFKLKSDFLHVQDHDGSHIKGLLINFIHSFWPSLLKVPTFLLEFITPIVKVLKDTHTLRLQPVVICFPLNF